MIEREQVQAMFDGARDYSWDIEGECLWGYFFTDSDREKLLSAAESLASDGFRFVAILEPTDGDDDQDTLSLHVERIERHTVDSLDSLNHRLYSFADAHGLGSYDGMDVGPVPP